MDILSSTGLINYFGKWRDLSEVEISPIVLKKNNTQLALYGLSHIHDARLTRLFRDHKVKIHKPEIPDDDIFNLMVLHQNRADRGRFNYLPEDKLPGFLDLVLWGHEHDCRIEPESNGRTKTWITQPGSSVATSLSEGESIEKKVGILEIHRKEFKMVAVKLKTVRPFIFRSINIDEFVDDLRLDEGDTRSKVEKFYCQNIAEMIQESKGRLSGHNKQPTVPLIRLRVLYTDENHIINLPRFGQKFDQQIANPESVLSFKKNIRRERNQGNNKLDEIAFKSAFDKKTQQDSVEDVVESYFSEIENKNDKLKLFGLKSLSEVCRLLAYNDDDDAASKIISKHFDKAFAFMTEKMCDEDEIPPTLEDFQLHKSKEAFNEAMIENSRRKTENRTAQNSRNEDDGHEMNDSIESVPMKAPTRGRSGRACRGASKARGRGSTKTFVG